MKKLKKYISILAAVAVMAAFAAVPAYALPAGSDETLEDAEITEVIDEDPDTTVEVEDEEDAEESGIDTSEGDEETIEVLDSDDPDIQETEDGEDAEETEPSGSITPVDTSSTAAQTQAPATTTAAAGPVNYTRTDPYTLYAVENVNVRQGPGTSYSIIGSVVATNEVKVIGTNGSWLVIDYYGNPGFVSADFFTSNAPETSATTAQAAPAPAETTTQAPPAETTQPVQPDDGAGEVVAPPAVSIEDDGGSEVQIEDDDNSAAVTTANQTPAETTSTTAAAASSTTDSNNGGGSIVGLLIALGCAVGTFLLVGVVPVVVHSIYHKKMYEY